MKKKIVQILIAAVMFCSVPTVFSMKSFVYAAENGFILPNSSSEYLSDEDIAGFSKQKLNYARNEIFARYGRTFNSQELNDYFSSQNWYTGIIAPDDFDGESLNDCEKQNVKFLLEKEKADGSGGYVLDQPGYDITAVDAEDFADASSNYKKMLAGEFVKLGKNIELDLNGDGQTESVELSLYESDGNGYNCYDLWVNNEEQSGEWENVKDLYGVSLDGETITLIVYAAGPSDDPVSIFYIYNTAGLHKAGEIYDWPKNMTVDDDGAIQGGERCNAMDTARINKSWTLEGNTLSEDVPPYYDMYNFMAQTEYYAYLRTPLEVHENMDFNSSVSILQPQNVKFPYTDAVSWVYVQGESGEGGWVNTCDWTYETRGYYFDGLLMAG